MQGRRATKRLVECKTEEHASDVYRVFVLYPSQSTHPLVYCCCSHINSHKQVRGHRTGSCHSGAEEIHDINVYQLWFFFFLFPGTSFYSRVWLLTACPVTMDLAMWAMKATTFMVYKQVYIAAFQPTPSTLAASKVERVPARNYGLWFDPRHSNLRFRRVVECLVMVCTWYDTAGI